MEFARHGYSANHGETTRKISTITPRWSKNKEVLEIRTDKPVSDFSTSSRYIYYFRFELDDIAQILSVLANKCEDIDDDTLREKLRSAVPDLLKIANVVSAA